MLSKLTLAWAGASIRIVAIGTISSLWHLGSSAGVISELFADYIAVLIATILGFMLVAGALIGNRLLSPRKPTRTKSITYECALLPIGRSRTQVHFRYYLFAIL